MNLAQIAMRAGQSDGLDGSDVVDIITFTEAPWGLNNKLFPVQRVILKALYGLPLDDVTPDVPVSDFSRENWQYFTEAGYLRWLFKEGRANVESVTPGVAKVMLVLAIGRRSGKTFITTCICAYETYKLIKKGNPQKYYGLAPSATIQIISVATDKDQAGLLYQGVKGHYLNCPFFAPYVANMTQTFATFQTPQDIEVYGPYATSPSKKASIKATFRSCVAEGLRGAGNIVAVLDEMAHFGENGSSSADEVMTALKPSIATFNPKDPNDNTKPLGPVESKLVAISSPLGQSGTFYELFQSGFAGGKDSQTMLCIRAPTWEVNPTIEAGFLEGEYRANAPKFFQEYGARFTSRTVTWIERVEDLTDCIDQGARPLVQAPARRPHFIGIDFAQANDATAIAVGHIDQEQRIVLDLIDQIKAGEGRYEGKDRLDFDEVADWIYAISRRFFLLEGMFDQASGIAFEQALAKRGLGRLKMTHMTRNLNSDIFGNFKNMMWDKRLVLYDWPVPDGKHHCEYIEELLELEAHYHSKYITEVQAPQVKGKHDDRSDALVRMVWLASQNVGKNTYVSKGASGAAARSSADTMQSQRVMAMRSRMTGSSPDRAIPRGPLRGPSGPFRGGTGGAFPRMPTSPFGRR